LPEACNIFSQSRTKYRSSCYIALISRFIPNERRFCDTLPSKQAFTSLNFTFLYWLRGRSIPKKHVTDGSPISFSLPSTHSTGGENVSYMTVSCLVWNGSLKEVGHLINCQKNCHQAPFLASSTCSNEERRRCKGDTQRVMSRSLPSISPPQKRLSERSLKPCKGEFFPYAVSFAVNAQQKTPQTCLCDFTHFLAASDPINLPQ